MVIQKSLEGTIGSTTKRCCMIFTCALSVTSISLLLASQVNYVLQNLAVVYWLMCLEVTGRGFSMSNDNMVSPSI